MTTDPLSPLPASVPPVAPAGTPRTTANSYFAEAFPHFRGTDERRNKQHLVVELDFARQLETELLTSATALESAQREIAELRKALQSLCEAGDAIGGYTLEQGHESPEADFLRELTKAAQVLALPPTT